VCAEYWSVPIVRRPPHPLCSFFFPPASHALQTKPFVHSFVFFHLLPTPDWGVELHTARLYTLCLVSRILSSIHIAAVACLQFFRAFVLGATAGSRCVLQGSAIDAKTHAEMMCMDEIIARMIGKALPLEWHTENSWANQRRPTAKGEAANSPGNRTPIHSAAVFSRLAHSASHRDKQEKASVSIEPDCPATCARLPRPVLPGERRGHFVEVRQKRWYVQRCANVSRTPIRACCIAWLCSLTSRPLLPCEGSAKGRDFCPGMGRTGQDRTG
jgi:hypothetical protein